MQEHNSCTTPLSPYSPPPNPQPHFPSMRADLVDQAAQIIKDPPILINMVSKRVRQIALGRPVLVERRPGLREADLALLEIIQGKITIANIDNS